MFKSLIDLDPNDYKDVFFLGVVVANDDSGEKEMKYTERIKVRIPGLYVSSNPAELPWCIPFKHRLFGSMSGQGSFCVPSIGSTVVVILQQGDPHSPAYIGSLLLDANTIAEFKTNYPRRYGFKDPAGNLFLVDTTDGQVTMQVQHKSGTTITVSDSGAITITGVDTMTVTAPLINMN